jgi:hypothetical protein
MWIVNNTLTLQHQFSLSQQLLACLPACLEFYALPHGKILQKKIRMKKCKNYRKVF